MGGWAWVGVREAVGVPWTLTTCAVWTCCATADLKSMSTQPTAAVAVAVVVAAVAVWMLRQVRVRGR